MELLIRNKFLNIGFIEERYMLIVIWIVKFFFYINIL